MGTETTELIDRDNRNPQEEATQRDENQPQQSQVPPQNTDTLRACQSCHRSKVRCERPSHSMPCTRCQKSRKPCVPADKPQSNQQQMNNHIAEMQSKIDMMISAAASQASAGEKSRPNGIPIDLSAAIQSFLENGIAPYLDLATIEIIFSRYVTHIAPTFPAVVFQPGTTASDVRTANPILLLAILDVASSGFCELGVQRKLRKLIVQTYVHCMLRSDQYTLGLLQALLVSATWYRSIEPLEPGEQMDIYQIGHTAANMALIMGLGESLSAKPAAHQGKLLDARRVWLGCHYICSNTSMSLRTPNVMRWTRCMDECVEVLETSPDALPSDKIFCRHIRLQHITEEFSMQLSMKDTSTPMLSQTQATDHAFKRRLADWRNNISGRDWNGALEFSYHFSSLYINEVIFCAASVDVTIETEVRSEHKPSPTVTIPVDAFSECVRTIDHIFRVFSSLDMSAIRALPSIHLIQMIYTVLMLVKLHFAAKASSNEDARSQVDRLHVSKRLNGITQMFAGWVPLWPATKLTAVFRRVHSWFEDDQRMQQEGSWLNVWRLASSQSASASATQMKNTQICFDDSQFLAPGSEGPHSWSASIGSTDVESVPLPFDFPLDQRCALSIASEQSANYPLIFNNVTGDENLGLSLNLEDMRELDAALGMDLDLCQVSGMRFGSGSLDPTILQEYPEWNKKS
ncbi:hypothetical protein BBP40_009928 [Aspergillus hancockii]|nr:hypothetical protein BBP40_009928 [Aspergillus hancockii]